LIVEGQSMLSIRVETGLVLAIRLEEFRLCFELHDNLGLKRSNDSKFLRHFFLLTFCKEKVTFSNCYGTFRLQRRRY